MAYFRMLRLLLLVGLGQGALLWAAPVPARETTFPPAVHQAVTRQLLDGLTRCLRKRGIDSHLADRIEKVELIILDKTLARDRSSNPSAKQVLKDLVSEIEDALPPAQPEESDHLRQAYKRVEHEYALTDARLFEDTQVQGTDSAYTGGLPNRSTGAVHEGFPPEVAELSRSSLPMSGLEAYVRGQMSSLGPVLRWPAAGGTAVIFSPGDFSRALDLVPWKPAKAYRLYVPGSVNVFQAHLLVPEDRSRRALILSGFINPSALLHTQALFHLYMLEHSLDFRVITDVGSGSSVQPAGGLLRAFGADSRLPRKFAGLLLGYYDETREVFQSRITREATGPGFSAFVAVVASRTYVGANTFRAWYGETLGETIRELLDSGLEFDSLYFAGSAGALGPAAAYSLAHPNCFYDLHGNRSLFANIFSDETQTLCHQTVVSPLLETHEYLLELKARGIRTLDMEGVYLIRAIAEHNRRPGRNIRAGISYLITDYPGGREASPYVLGRPKYAEKREGVLRYSRMLLRHLEDPGGQPANPAVGIYSGSFDPPTLAHKAIIEAALKNHALKKLFVLLKIDGTKNYTASSRERRRMLEIMLEPHKSKMEIIPVPDSERPGIMDELYRNAVSAGETPYLFVGEDSASRIPESAIQKPLLRLVVFRRPGKEAPLSGFLQTEFIDIPAIKEISSTNARMALVRGDLKAAAPFIDANVLKYIKETGLYRALSESLPQSP